MGETARSVISKEAYAGWVNPNRVTMSAIAGDQRVNKASILSGAKLSSFADQKGMPAGIVQGKSALDPARWFEHYEARTRQKERPRPLDSEGTAAWIQYFNTNWRQENLPEDWFNLQTQSSKKVGFILDQQMDLLRDPFDAEALSDWSIKTKRDLEGFKLEFLTDNVVYPRKYFWKATEKGRLEDPLYGKSRDGSSYARLSEIVSSQERNGSVKEALEKVEEFFANAPDKSIAFITSPLGETGFKTKDGLAIDYPDSYFFILQKNGDEVINYTVKTDLNLEQCHRVNSRITGRALPEQATAEDQVRAIATIASGERDDIQSIDDIISVLESEQPSHAFIDKQNNKTTSWSEVREQIGRGEDLYLFEVDSAKAISDFDVYVKEGGHTKEELHRAISATILRLGELFFSTESPSQKEVTLRHKEWHTIEENIKFGAILEKTAERRGCSGGGSSGATPIDTIGGKRSGTIGGGDNDQYGSLHFNCPHCGFDNIRERGRLISTCGENASANQGCKQRVDCV